MIQIDSEATLKIGNNVGASSTIFWCSKEITIGDNVRIGGNCIMIDTDAHSLDYRIRRKPKEDRGVAKPIHIEDDVMIGVNVIILKGVTVGARSVIGAGSVVTHSIPADCIAAGNPAKIIKHIK